jgi:hypothetical protein
MIIKRPYITGGAIDLSFILALRTDEEFLTQFAGTPLMRAKRDGLLRNACCVAANTNATSLIPLLGEILRVETSGLIRLSAVYALSKLRVSCDTAEKRVVERFLEFARFDSDSGVRNAFQLVASD